MINKNFIAIDLLPELDEIARGGAGPAGWSLRADQAWTGTAVFASMQARSRWSGHGLGFYAVSAKSCPRLIPGAHGHRRHCGKCPASVKVANRIRKHHRTSATMVRFLLLFWFAAACMTNPGEAAERRVALVVGAANYAHATALAHSLDDARDIAAALKRLGFEVDLVLNPNRGELENAVRRLGERSRGADASLFYYSGHALESQGINWVLPVSADIQNDRVLRFEALELDAVRGQVEGLARVSLIFLDACREDPFKQRLGAARDVARSGLASVQAAVTGAYVAFATAPGTVAADGNGLHSPFTGSLLKYIETPGLELRQMMSKVRADVEEATDDRQIPWDQSSLKGDFYFNPANSDKASETVVRAINGPNPQVDLDALFWDSVDKKKAADLNAYLVKFPQGAFAELARNRLAELNAAPVASAPPNPKLLDALAIVQSSLTPKAREDYATAYQAAQEHKAIAGYLSNGQSMRVAGRQSAQEAEESGLEACEVYAGAPCVLIVLDDNVTFTSDSTARAMPRVHYAGVFNPERIPSVTQSARRRPDVAGYLSAPNSKAAAYHPSGFLFIVTGSANLRDAEERVLALCNDDSPRGGRGGPCYLYASNDDVVLSLRSKVPITPAGAIAQQESAKPPTETPTSPKLLEALASALPSIAAKFREDNAASYQKTARHKALAVVLSSGWILGAGGRQSELEAEESVLERCEVFAGSPCVLIAVNDDIKYLGNGQASPAMPRVHYAGSFDPERVPSVPQGVRQRPDVVNYLSAPNSKAAAYNPSSQLFIATGAANQRAAEEQALAACNDDPSHNQQRDGPCYLYASGTAVVLARRSRAPITDATVAGQVTAPATNAFHEAFATRIERALPALGAAARESTAKAYEEAAPHKAFAVHGKDSGFYRMASWPTATAVEEAALEGCQSYYGEPCALLAVDDMMRVGADDVLAPRDMPRVRYEGNFDARQIPALTAAIRSRADLQAYAGAGGFKAVAFHPWGQAYVTHSSDSQNDAETKALASCNGEPTRKGQGGPCYLYAAGNQVVFAKRLRLAMTPVANATQPVTTPVTKPAASDDNALIDSISSRLVAKLSSAQPSMPEEALRKTQYLTSAQTYVSNQATGHKAIAAGAASGKSTVTIAYGEPTAQSAQALALERCQVHVVDPCALIAFDRIVAPADGSWKPIDMARLHYTDAFDASLIPGLAAAERDRPEVRDYGHAPLPKAAVIDNTGKLFVAAWAKSQVDAEGQALAKCGGSACYLYAVGNQVILPQRLTKPRPLGTSLADVLAYAMVQNAASMAGSFAGWEPHKSLVLFPERSQTWNATKYNSAADAERVALEGCGLKYNTVCVTVAMDGKVATPDPASVPRRPQARVIYQGSYRPEMVPLFDTPPQKARDYVKMRAPKAMAIRPGSPSVTVETGATVAEAEAKALAKCTDPGSPYPCFLYAVNDNVVLPLRRTEPDR
jgi:hypothetical protein